MGIHESNHCTAGDKECSNYAVMNEHFVKDGNVVDCAGCCLWCKKTDSCEYACVNAAQMKLF